MYALLFYRHRLRHRIPGNTGRGAEGRCAAALLDGNPMVNFVLSQAAVARPVHASRSRRRTSAS